MRLYGADTETGLIIPGLAAPPLACLSIVRDDGAERIFSGADGVAWLKQRLAEPDNHFVFHGAAFDTTVLAAADLDLLPLFFEAYEQERIHCTVVREKLAAIAKGELKWTEGEHGTERADFTLEELAMRYRGVKLDKHTWRLGYGDYVGRPIDDMPAGAREYAITDAREALGVWGEQSRAYAEKGWFVDAHRQTYSDFVLRLMSVWGVRTDPKAINELRAHLQKRKAEIFTQLMQDRIIRPDGSRNMKYIKTLIQEALGVKTPLTEKGNIATDEDTLAKAAVHDKRLSRLADYGHVQKLEGTYLGKLEQGIEHPINSKFNVLVESGRTSCSGDKATGHGTNLQNPPTEPGVRECYVPREGFVFCSTDYNFVELCTLAQTCIDLVGFSVLGDTINDGKDPHTWFAAKLIGRTYEEAEYLKKTNDAAFDDMRQLAKVADFGYPGGLGADSFVDYARGFGVIISSEKSAWLREQYFGTWLEMPPYFAFINDNVLRGRPEGEVIQLRSGRVRGRVRYTQACNTYFQGLAADGAKAALRRVAYECYVDKRSPLYGSRIVVFAHDELILEIPEWRAHEAAHRLAEIMIAEMKRFTPDVKIGAEPALMRRWIKKAKPVYVDGRLVPWAPKEKAAA